MGCWPGNPHRHALLLTSCLLIAATSVVRALAHREPSDYVHAISQGPSRMVAPSAGPSRQCFLLILLPYHFLMVMMSIRFYKR